ncbi:MAG TPA: hypothetical protein V6C52_06145 [Coleofasciculaceae cyanobacterium]|jgi:hypothetical protein
MGIQFNTARGQACYRSPQPNSALRFSGVSKADSVRFSRLHSRDAASDAESAGSGDRGFKFGSALGTGLKWALLSNFLTIPAGLFQIFPLGLISGGLGIGTGCASIILGPLAFGALGFLKGGFKRE